MLMHACACVWMYALRTVSLNKTLRYRNTLLLQNYLLFSVTIKSIWIIIFIRRRQLAAFLLAGLCGRWFLLVLLTHGHKGETSLITDHDSDQCVVNKSTQTKQWPERQNNNKTMTWKMGSVTTTRSPTLICKPNTYFLTSAARSPKPIFNKTSVFLTCHHKVTNVPFQVWLLHFSTCQHQHPLPHPLPSVAWAPVVHFWQQLWRHISCSEWAISFTPHSKAGRLSVMYLNQSSPLCLTLNQSGPLCLTLNQSSPLCLTLKLNQSFPFLFPWTSSVHCVLQWTSPVHCVSYLEPVQSPVSYLEPVQSTVSYLEPVQSTVSYLEPVQSTVSYLEPLHCVSYLEPVQYTVSYLELVQSTVSYLESVHLAVSYLLTQPENVSTAPGFWVWCSTNCLIALPPSHTHIHTSCQTHPHFHGSIHLMNWSDVLLPYLLVVCS